jgi:hypothetical protein
MTHADTLLHKASVRVPGFSYCVVELEQHIIGVHPGAFSFIHHGAVTTPGITVELFYVRYHFSAHGIEVDIPDQSQEIVVFIAEDGFVTILEEMPGSAIATIEIQGVPGEQFSHDSGDAGRAALEKKVYVIVHQDPGIDGAFIFRHCMAESIEEPGFIFVVSENIRLVDPPAKF